MGYNSQFFNIESEEFREGPRLPQDFSSHCAVAIDGNQVALLGGYMEGDFACVYDYKADSFTQLPSMQIGRQGHYCGVADSGRGRELIVVGKQIIFWGYGGILGSASKVEFPVSLGKHASFTP